MRIDVCPKYSKLSDSRISGSTVIVIDVLRSTTCIICAVKNGASCVIPAVDPGEAATIYGKLDTSDCIIAGEVGGIKHPDFNIGNSPFEFASDVVGGKTIIASTSNGTAAIVGVKSAKHIFLGSMINASFVAKRAVELGDDVIIVCAGTNDNISADDMCAAGAVIDALGKSVSTEKSDIAFVCEMLYIGWKKGEVDLSQTTHWSKLLQLGFEKDVEFCFSQDVIDVVPEYKNGIIE